MMLCDIILQGVEESLPTTAASSSKPVSRDKGERQSISDSKDEATSNRELEDIKSIIR